MHGALCLTLPKELIQKIDSDRGDINRSRYILRLIEKAYDQEKIRKNVTDRFTN